MKNQYGPPAASIAVHYQRGLFLPESATGQAGHEKQAAEQKVDHLFRTLLRRWNEQGRNVNHNPCSTYAPTLFAREPEAKAANLKAPAFANAMTRLFAANKIRVDTSGPASRKRSLIVEVDSAQT
jgi:hypothetical protein